MFQDVKPGDLPHSVRRDLRALYEFYLDEERRARLAQLSRPRRILSATWWLLRSLLHKLTPQRRLFLAIAFGMALSGRIGFQIEKVEVSTDLTRWAFLIVLFILMLELKDKLLAKDEIAVARQVQLALLPAQDPSHPLYALWSHTRPANDVGGDLVDYIEGPSPGTLGVALGDVAGKGLGAALLMAKLQASLRATAPGCLSLAEMGARLNQILCRNGLDNRFATLFYAELPAGGIGPVRCLNAGHNPPLLVRSGAVETIDPQAVPLGMFPDSRYAEGRVELSPGDLLVIYSDGLVEACDSTGTEFGLERLRRLVPSLRGLPVGEAGRSLLLTIDQFLGRERPHDDLSIILVRREG
jgi:sigma-B regulation protein RsbU (phosphoserine phosphatase)